MTDDRPDGCMCWDHWHDADALPCWPCYRAGFRSANPNPPTDDDADETDASGQQTLEQVGA